MQIFVYFVVTGKKSLTALQLCLDNVDQNTWICDTGAHMDSLSASLF